MVNTPSTVLVGPTSMITPSVNGTYRFTLAITETSAGIAGTCTTGNIGLSLSYKQADSGVTYALGTTVEGAWFTIFGSSITSTTTTIAGGAPGANNDARIIPIEFRAASGTPIQFQVFENTAGNCTTPPVVTIRPALYFAGF